MSEILRQITDMIGNMTGQKGKIFMLLGMKDGKALNGSGSVKIIKKYKNGNLLIKPLRAADDSRKVRRELASQIVDLVRDDIKAQSDKMVMEALQHRRTDELKIMRKEIISELKESGESGIKLTGSRGCVYMSYGKGKKERSVLL